MDTNYVPFFLENDRGSWLKVRETPVIVRVTFTYWI